MANVVRRFGPTFGAGVVIEEKQGERRVEDAPTGVTIMIGEFESGTPQEADVNAGRKDFDRRCGGRIYTSYCPNAAQDFYTYGRGSGLLITHRVTGGDEVAATLNMYNRGWYTGGMGLKLVGTLSAKSGGRWAGRRSTHVGDITGGGDLTSTTIDTGEVMIANEWTGGTLELKRVTTKTYRIVSNTAAGVVSVEADATLSADWGAGVGTPTNRYALTRANTNYLGDDQHLSARFKDGQENPTSEWGVEIRRNGSLVLNYQNLSSDPISPRYWVNVINRDKSNYEIVAADLYTGDRTVADIRPCNLLRQGLNLSTTVLTFQPWAVTITSPTGAEPNVVINSLGSKSVPQTITGTVSGGGLNITWTADLPGGFSQVQGAFNGVATELGEELINVTVTNGPYGNLADGDTIDINYMPLAVDEAIGGKVWPDVVNYPNLYFYISDNARNSVTVRTGLDLTNGGLITSGTRFKLEYDQEMTGGNDGTPVTDSDFLAALDVNLSPLIKLAKRNYGLVKVACPGVTSTTVQQAGLEFVAAMNWQFRVQFPSSTTTELAAIDYINTTIGRSDYGVCFLPSYAYVEDPDSTPGSSEKSLKLLPNVGMQLGREAMVAAQYVGYHKAAAGLDVTLPGILELPTGTPETATDLNEELLNPQGINVIKFEGATAIMWGDRTTSPTSEWKWKHQRELMSHYENVLRNQFKWIVFAINEEDTQDEAVGALTDYFYQEWNVKGALRGVKFEDAADIKIDDEINTDATRASGDLNAEIVLRLADTVERFRIVMSKAGIFDSIV